MTLRRELPVDGGFDVEAALAVFANHAVPGGAVCHPASATHTRLASTSRGPRLITLRLEAERVRLFADAEPALIDEIDSLVRFWLDLDTDPAPIAAHLGGDEILGPLVRRRPTVRVVRWPELFEGIILTIVGQQVSLSTGRVLGGRLLARYGDRGPGGLLVFPTAAVLARQDPAEVRHAVGIPGARARSITAAAQAFIADPALRSSAGPEAFDAAFRRLPGVGPWTADYVAVRGLGLPDAFTPTDLVARRALGRATPDEASRLAQPWRPWRAYALAHLWLSAS